MKENQIKLQFPIPVKQEEGPDIETDILTFQRLKLKHLKVLPDSVFEGDGDLTPKEAIPLIAVLTGIPEESADEIDIIDLEPIAEKIPDFLASFLKTGKS